MNWSTNCDEKHHQTRRNLIFLIFFRQRIFSGAEHLLHQERTAAAKHVSDVEENGEERENFEEEPSAKFWHFGRKRFEKTDFGMIFVETWSKIAMGSEIFCSSIFSPTCYWERVFRRIRVNGDVTHEYRQSIRNVYGRRKYLNFWISSENKNLNFGRKFEWNACLLNENHQFC